MIKIKKSDFLLIPNLISSARLLLFPIIFLLFLDYSHNRLILLILALVSVILDNLDGYFARKLNQISELGKIIDPLADKLLIGIYAIGLYINNLLNPLLFLIIIGRDILIILGSLLFASKLDKVNPSNKLGKWTAFFIVIYLLIILIKPELKDYLFFSIYEYFLMIVIFLSLINYLFANISLFKKIHDKNI